MEWRRIYKNAVTDLVVPIHEPVLQPAPVMPHLLRHRAGAGKAHVRHKQGTGKAVHVAPCFLGGFWRVLEQSFGLCTHAHCAIMLAGSAGQVRHDFRHPCTHAPMHLQQLSQPGLFF